MVAAYDAPASAGVPWGSQRTADDIRRCSLKTLLAWGRGPEAVSEDETRTPTISFVVLDSSGKPCFKIGFDDTDIRERLRIDASFRFIGDCHWISAFPGLKTHSYAYDYRVPETKYRALALPLAAARCRVQLATLEEQEPGPMRDAALAEVLTALAPAREYILSVRHIFAGNVGRCRLPISKPELKARLVSALETKMRRTAFKLCFQFQLAPL
jgi:hypothetical protein